jgi:hypothetical protein
MGSLLRKRFKFSTLRSIREAYSAAFSENEKKARTEKLDAALADRTLDALNLVRNVIVHKAGIADARYAERSRLFSLAPKRRAGEPLELDGGVCVALMKPVVASCLSLVNGVDMWLELTRHAVTS